MMMNNGVNFYPPFCGSIPFVGLPNNFNQWSSSIQKDIPSSYYSSLHQNQQMSHQLNNKLNVSNNSLFKLYDIDRNNRNEIIHLMFSFAGISFKDKRIKQEKWDKTKEQMPNLQLPILQVNNQFKIYYLNPIIRYLAREFHLYGTDNHDHSIIDIIFELNHEFQEKIFEQIENTPDIYQQKINLTQFITNYATIYLNQFEKFYKIFNCHGPFYLDSRISLADLIVYQTINYLIDIDSNILDNYTHLKQARYHLENHPRLSNYFNKKNPQIRKKRHATLSPILNNIDPSHHHHHRHQSYDVRRSSYDQNYELKESIPPLNIKQETKFVDIQPEENELTPLPVISEEKSPTIDIQSEEKESKPLLSISEEKSPSVDIQSEEKESTPPPIVSKEKSPSIDE